MNNMAPKSKVSKYAERERRNGNQTTHKFTVLYMRQGGHLDLTVNLLLSKYKPKPRRAKMSGQNTLSKASSGVGMRCFCGASLLAMTSSVTGTIVMVLIMIVKHHESPGDYLATWRLPCYVTTTLLRDTRPLLHLRGNR